jgi:hypothetical protein
LNDLRGRGQNSVPAATIVERLIDRTLNLIPPVPALMRMRMRVRAMKV